jgi:hypothetical protein
MVKIYYEYYMLTAWEPQYCDNFISTHAPLTVADSDSTFQIVQNALNENFYQFFMTWNFALIGQDNAVNVANFIYIYSWGPDPTKKALIRKDLNL